MAKKRTSFVCTQCGSVQVKWAGKCSDCGEWDTLEEVRLPTTRVGNGFGGGGGGGGSDSEAFTDPQRGLAENWPANAATASAGLGNAVLAPPKALPLGQIKALEVPRINTNISELDRVLGGGFVPGSVILLGGEPGIGKSTLMLQAAAEIAADGRRVLYVTSEESTQQTQLRANRLNLANNGDRLFLLADTNLARIFEQVRQIKPALLVIDSVQMVYKSSLEAAPGSITQIRQCCMELVYLAKTSGCVVALVGHVTKEGRVAGPRLLEHLVDSVLYFEGDHFHAHRLVRAVKNRYGNTLEIGLFEMTGCGLAPINDPTGTALGTTRDGNENGIPGSVIAPVMQGSRCFLIEIQALTATGILGAAKRRVSGLDGNRLPMLIAVLEKYVELRLADQDIFASSVGGLRIIEPAADLALSLAIAGVHYNRALSANTVAIGEVGLGGEIRRVNSLSQRLREAARLGYAGALVPSANTPGERKMNTPRFIVKPVSSLNAAMDSLH